MMIADNLRKLRKSIGLTQCQVADMLGLKRSTYSYYEIGKSTPDIKMITKMTKLFGVSYEELIGVPPINKNSPCLSFNDITNNSDDTVSFQSMIDLTKHEKLLVSLYRLLPDEKKKFFMNMLEENIKEVLKEGNR